MKNRKGKNFLYSPAVIWFTGLFALLWVLFRSGTNPKRLAYPCQQASFPLASAWVLAYVPLFERFTRYIAVKNRNWVLVFSLILGVTVLGVGYKYRHLLNFKNTQPASLVLLNPANPVSEIYAVDNIPATSGSLAAGNASVPDAFLSDKGMDDLVGLMEASNNPFFKTPENAHGIVGKSDLVLIKANFQWRHRLGTNTDRIKGLIWQILNHPSGFAGEILVVDNQEKQLWESSDYFAGYNDRSNNSDDTQQSIVDVINTFKAKGYPVDYYSWDNLNTNIVTEFSDGNNSEGYIYNSTTKTSYPKFVTPKGAKVSFSKGIWDGSGYSKNNYTIINFPVLKAHGLAGATIALKNYIGVMNTTKSNEWFGGGVDDNFHPHYCFSDYALVAREMEIAWPDLNIVDATWVATYNNYDYNGSFVNQKTVLASTDPVAVSWYAAKNILTPNASDPSATDPDRTDAGASAYSTILNHWYNYLKQNTSFPITKSENEIAVYSASNPPVVGVKEVETFDDKFTIAPNPFVNAIELNSKTGEINSAITVSIVDVSGKEVYRDEISNFNGTHQIQLHDQPVGNYYLNISNGEYSLTKQIIQLKE